MKHGLLIPVIPSNHKSKFGYNFSNDVSKPFMQVSREILLAELQNSHVAHFLQKSLSLFWYLFQLLTALPKGEIVLQQAFLDLKDNDLQQMH